MGNLLHAPDDQEERRRGSAARRKRERKEARTEGTYKLQGGKAEDGCRSLLTYSQGVTLI